MWWGTVGQLAGWRGGGRPGQTRTRRGGEGGLQEGEGALSGMAVVVAPAAAAGVGWGFGARRLGGVGGQERVRGVAGVSGDTGAAGACVRGGSGCAGGGRCGCAGGGRCGRGAVRCGGPGAGAGRGGGGTHGTGPAAMGSESRSSEGSPARDPRDAGPAAALRHARACVRRGWRDSWRGSSRVAGPARPSKRCGWAAELLLPALDCITLRHPAPCASNGGASLCQGHARRAGGCVQGEAACGAARVGGLRLRLLRGGLSAAAAAAGEAVRRAELLRGVRGVRGFLTSTLFNFNPRSTVVRA